MPQSARHRQSVRELLRRVDEVRGLSSPPPADAPRNGEEPDLLLATASELVEELERSHRRLIETNVQLVSLREVANSMVSSPDDETATRTVTLYLLHAFAFHEVFLLLANREDQALEGSWCRRAGSGTESIPLRVPLVGEPGVVARAVWWNRTLTVRDPRRNPPLAAPPGHPLARVLEGLGAYTIVPLQRSRRPDSEDADACPPGCPFQCGTSEGAPAPDALPDWTEARDARRRRCLDCGRFPVLGVVGVARRGGTGLGDSEITLLESVALSVAPVLENARLYHDLRRGQRFLDHILNSMGAGLVAVGLDGRILTFNRAAEELTGHQAGYVVGEPLSVVFPEEGRRLVDETLRTGRELARRELELQRPDGAAVPVGLSTSLLRDERRQTYGAIATFTDLTRLKRMEQRIRQLDRLAALGRFTTSVAHEVRNPLAGIAAGVEYLRKGFPEGAREHGHVEFIQNEIARLDRIVGDLFTVTHPKKLLLRRADLAETVERSLQSVQALLQEKRLAVAWTLPEGPTVARFDPDQMQQVCINLVKNAAEASPEEGRITLRLWTGPGDGEVPLADAAAGVLCLAVQDQGPGIPAEHLHRLFEPFFTTKAGGTGLGLYICHDIVKRHGGSLRALSEPGSGATFLVELPLDPLHGGHDD